MKYTPEIQSKILELSLDKDWSSRMIADKLGISKSGVNDYLASYRENNPEVQEDKKPKILLLDVETSASVVVSFGRRNVNLSQDHVLSEGGWILSYAYKYLGDTEVKGSVLTPDEALDCNDERLAAEVWDLIEDSAFVIGHNIDNFDLPVIKARCIVNGIPPIRKIRTIDTLKIAKEFRFNSNKLESLCKQLDLSHKIKHSGISLWVNCQYGDPEALQEMYEYNVGDIDCLEELYLLTRSYSTRHPNLAINFGDTIRCNICTSPNVQPTGNTVSTNLSVFEEYKCECGCRFKSRKSLTSKDQRSKFLSN